MGQNYKKILILTKLLIENLLKFDKIIQACVGSLQRYAKRSLTRVYILP